MCNHDRQRRQFIAGLAASPLLLAGCAGGGDDEEATPSAPSPSATRIPMGGAGCYRPQYASAQPDGIACGVMQTFGDPRIDSQWLEEIQIQTQFFAPVQASVYVLDECSPANANAVASPEGYILFGRHFAAKLIQQTGTPLPIAGVLAHEWGHRAQFTFGWMVQSEPTARRTELEADMWAGLYMGLAKLWTGPLLQSFFQTLFSGGDYNFHSPSHHGTPNQRYAAGATGLSLALQLLQTHTRLGYPQVHSLFVNEISRILATVQLGDEPRLRTLLDKATDSLSPETAQIARRMDGDWISGIARGERTLSELTALPALPIADRMNLAPY